MDVEIIPFEVPATKDHVVCLPKIKWDDSQEELWAEINKIFSAFGLIYRVFISQTFSYDDQSKSFYSYVRYFSKRATKEALHHSGKITVNEQNIKITRSLKDYNFRNKKLSPYEAEQLMSHYFGFNFWNCKITYLHKEKVQREADFIVKYICQVRIATRDGLWSDGIGFGEAELLNIREIGSSYRAAVRFAINAAKIDAFSKFLIVALPNGKRMIEVDTTKPDQLYLGLSSDNVSVKVIGELDSDPDEAEEEEWIENLPESLLDNLLEVSNNG